MFKKQFNIEDCFIKNKSKIEEWFLEKWADISPPIYGSVDLRNSGFKLAPVDMNLFPAGFNNIDEKFIPLCINAIKNAVQKCNEATRRILLVSENHTRNVRYFESLAFLRRIVEKAGFNVAIGSLAVDIEGVLMDLPSGEKLFIQRIKREGNKIFVGDDFVPCLVWLNNDFSDEIPEIMLGLDQVVRPPLQLGWSSRLKSGHFSFYELVAREFSRLLQIDPWFISPVFSNCNSVDFLKKEGMDCLEEKAEELFSAITQKYEHYGIKEKPFLIMKSNSGTYGMSVMPIFDAKELRNLSRKKRNHMSSSKGGGKVSSVILQEGVYSFESFKKNVCEPVIYLIGSSVIGGFYRVNSKGVTENLNSPGMYFDPFIFLNSEEDSKIYVYGVVARLSMLAATLEKNSILSDK